MKTSVQIWCGGCCWGHMTCTSLPVC